MFLCILVTRALFACALSLHLEEKKKDSKFDSSADR